MTQQPIAPEESKILIVDDMVTNAELLAELLALEGYQTTVAAGGKEALEKIATERPNVVLLDVMMPDIDGFEVCRRIKSDPSTLFVGVILVTALGDVEHRIMGAAAGADDFLTKPPDEQELLARIKSLTRVGSLQAALEESNRQLQGLLEERTRQLEDATSELQKLLEDNMQSGAKIVPASYFDSITSRPPNSIEDASSADTLERMREFKRGLVTRLSSTLEGRADLVRTPEMLAQLSQRLAAIYTASGLNLLEDARQR